MLSRVRNFSDFKCLFELPQALPNVQETKTICRAALRLNRGKIAGFSFLILSDYIAVNKIVSFPANAAFYVLSYYNSEQ